jgi:small conductance mechanosensitive channel
MTKRFSCYVLDVGIAYHEDVDEVMAVLREIDEGLRREPEYSRDILEPLEIMGLDRFTESAVIIRARVKTRPMQQWRIGREFNRRIKKTFDERGIEMPLPSHTLYWGVPKAGVPPAVQMTLEGQESHPCTDAAESDRNLPPDVAAPRS